MKSFDIPFQFRSTHIKRIKEIRASADQRKKDWSPTRLLFDDLEILIGRHFGFCFGVQNAVEQAYKIIDEHPDKRKFLLSEIIHNPYVNQDLQEKGIQFIFDQTGQQMISWDQINEEDIVIIPAFGTTAEIQQTLADRSLRVEAFDTTCPFVERVWNKGEQLAKEGYTIVIHGNSSHEETKATLSQCSQYGKAVVVQNMREADILKAFILGGALDARDWGVYFKWQASKGFSYSNDFNRIAVVNQTTMLASETEEISNFLKDVMREKFPDKPIDEIFGSTRDTLCYATNDNQTATIALMDEKPDLAIVIGGYNSSNTTHLVELLENECPTYFIRSSDDLLSDKKIKHLDIQSKETRTSDVNLSGDRVKKIALTCGASCPDAMMEQVLLKLLSFSKKEQQLAAAVDQLIETYTNGL